MATEKKDAKTVYLTSDDEEYTVIMHIAEDGSITYETVPTVQRNYKDRLFRLIFGEPRHIEWSLNLYNALENKNYTDPDELEIVTLQNALYLSMKNDVAVLVASKTFHFWEQQSTLSVNITCRLLLYFDATLRRFLHRINADLQSSKQIRIPKPKFYVFYNGRKYAEKRTVLRLRDLYENDDESSDDPEDPTLELTAIQININGYADEPGSCRQLYEYQWVVEKIRLYSETMEMTVAVDRMFDEMPKDFTIREWLLENRSEVKDMLLFEYKEELHEETLRQEGREEGFDEGFGEGIEVGIRKTAEVLQELKFSDNAIQTKLLEKFPDHADSIKRILESV